MPRNALIQVRRDTAANWTSANPTLAAGEIGFETDTGKLKVGTGSTAWTSLLYATDASDITGATLASNVTASSLTSVGTLGSLAVSGDLTVDTNTLKVDSTNNRVGVNTTSPGTALDVVGTITARAGATQDGVALAGRAGGTSSYEVTLQPTTLTADQTLTLPNVSGTAVTTGNLTDITSTGTLSSLTVTGDLTVDTNTLKVDSTNNRVGVNVASPAVPLDVVGRVEVRAAATQDGVALAGRAGGTSSYEVTLQPTTLTADRTITLPDSSGTLAYISSIETDAIGYESGAYYTAMASGLSNSVAFTTNTAYYIPFFVTKSTTFDRIAVRGSASMTGTSTVRLGIYNNSNGKPTTVVNDYGTVSVSVSTTGEITISKSLERGWYWLVAVAQTSTGNNNFQACNPVLPAHNTRVASSFTPVMYAGWSQTGVTGALATAGTLSESNQPIATMLRAA